MVAALATYYKMPALAEDGWPAALIFQDRISPRFMRDHRVLPVRIEDSHAVVAIADPEDAPALAALSVALERKLEPRLASGARILSAIDALLDGRKQAAEADALGATASSVNEEDVEQLKDLALEAPVIDFVNRIFREAAASRATDIHIEPARGRVVLRRRVDGLLGEIGTVATAFGRAVVSRIKILSRLNIAERRLPQDGRARLRIEDRDFDVRVATMPTVHGEGVAIRFLSSAHQLPEIGKLGLGRRDEELLRTQIAFPNGLIAVTGPTGSGKTTTLAALLGELNDASRKIVTIEDPVEYQIDGVNQIQVKTEIGLTFANTLRSLLRFDPDIIMIGEMRDSETARIGVHAALTGHLVLTTLHTNSAAAAISRLLDLGVQGYLVASTLRCVVAQRLVRRLCGTCRRPMERIPEQLAITLRDLAGGAVVPGIPWRAVGCDRCGGSGYHGRIAIFDILAVDESIRSLIKPDVNAGTIAAAARQSGMTTMMMDGLAKCRDGLTTVEEIGRVALGD